MPDSTGWNVLLIWQKRVSDILHLIRYEIDARKLPSEVIEKMPSGATASKTRNAPCRNGEIVGVHADTVLSWLENDYPEIKARASKREGRDILGR